MKIATFRCKECELSFEDYTSNERSGFCSLKCYWNSKKGTVGHWKGKKRPNMTGRRNPKWLGESVGYIGAHLWLRRTEGCASKCENRERHILPFACSNKSGHFDWAYKYKVGHARGIKHYIQLCKSCHRKYDSKKV